MNNTLDFESECPGWILNRSVLKQDTISQAHTLSRMIDILPCVSRLLPLIHVRRLSVTCKDGLLAPVPRKSGKVKTYHRLAHDGIKQRYKTMHRIAIRD